MNADLGFVIINPPERKRTYCFPERNLVVENVSKVCVRPSGSHRVETADGKKFIVSPGWLWIELDMDNWTF